MKKIIITISILVVLVLSGCIQQTEKTQVANPASVYCEEQGGTLEIKTNEDGSQTGYCTLSDGTICEEWAFYRGECPEVKTCNGLSLKEATDIAGKDLNCNNIGTISENGTCNENTKTWWLDIETELDGDLGGCNPACVIDTESKNATINWRCMGLIEPEDSMPLLMGAELMGADYGPYGGIISDKIKSILNNIKDTEYVHAKIDEEHINESAGKYHTDCSGLVGFILQNELPDHFGAINKTGGSRNRGIPYAKNYYEFFKNQPNTHDANCWQRIHWYKNTRPGDIIAYVYGDGGDHEDTGHVMIAYSELQKQDGKNERCFLIADSTANPHGNPETRGGKGEPENGVGNGEICLGVDGGGRYVRWDGPDDKKLHRLIVIGRAVEC